MLMNFKKVIIVLVGSLLMLIISGCTTADLYRLNYPDDPDMQQRMERDYGDEPLWNYNS